MRWTQGRSLMVVLALLASIAAPTPLRVDAAAAPPFEISIAVTWWPTYMYSVPWMVGMQKGIFEELGVRIKNVVPGKGGATTLRNVLAGDLAFGDVSANALVEGWLSGAPVMVVGGAVQTFGESVYVTRLGTTDINKPLDMKGRKWGFTNPNSTSEGMARLIVKRTAGLGPDDVKYVATGGVSEGLTLLKRNEVDLAIFPDPMYQVEKDKYKFVFRASDYVPKYQQTMIMVQPEFAKKHPDIVRAVLVGYAKAVTFIEKNPEEAGRIYAKIAERLPEAAAIDSVKAAAARKHWNVGFEKEALELMEESLKPADRAKLKWSQIINQEYLPPGYRSELPKAK